MCVKVVCGLIRNSKGEYFIASRAKHKSMAGKWEFPGGKLEPYETEQDCLQRELLEELGMKVDVEERLGEHTYHYEKMSVNLIAYKCKFVSANYTLVDHDQYAWVTSEELLDYELTEADVPFVAYC